MLLEETEGIRGARQEVGRNAALGGPRTRVQGGKGAENKGRLTGQWGEAGRGQVLQHPAS